MSSRAPDSSGDLADAIRASARHRPDRDARPTAARGLPVVFLDYLSRARRSAPGAPVAAGVPGRYETVEPDGAGLGSG